MHAKFYNLSYDERIEFVNLVTRKYTEKQRSSVIRKLNPNEQGSSTTIRYTKVDQSIYEQVMSDPQVIEWQKNHGID